MADKKRESVIAQRVGATLAVGHSPRGTVNVILVALTEQFMDMRISYIAHEDLFSSWKADEFLSKAVHEYGTYKSAELRSGNLRDGFPGDDPRISLLSAAKDDARSGWAMIRVTPPPTAGDLTTHIAVPDLDIELRAAIRARIIPDANI
ncbi:hypothetical protein [Amycolatopsis minnesotensis]|uniref:Uncharacterized protein n=1 Tax=Amycolatopsis minnesotensis TaxID=337894 RepID=A0ABN2RJE9_9PSEU